MLPAARIGVLKRFVHPAVTVSLSVVFLVPVAHSTDNREAEPAAFAQAFVESLSWAQQAISREIPDAVFKAAVELKMAATEFETAAAHIERFTRSPSEVVRVAAGGAHATYKTLSEIDRKTATLLLRSTQVQTAAEITAVQEAATELIAERNHALKVVTYAAVGVTQALVSVRRDAGPQDAIGTRLVLTVAQRSHLLQRLETTFGHQVKEGLRAGQPAIVGAGALLYQFLTKRGWTATDE